MMFKHLRFLFVALASWLSIVAYNDAAPSFAQFSYCYDTELVFGNQPGVALDPAVEALAVFENGWLNHAKYFDSQLICDAKKTRKEHLKKKPCKSDIGKIYEIETIDGVMLRATYFDRGSDTLLVIGEGFTNNREQMSSFIDMFPDFDIVLFDFRGHEYEEMKLFEPSTWTLDFVKYAIGIDTSLIRFGQDEDLDVVAIVNGFKYEKERNNNGKTYANVYGVGICYGAFIFAKTASLHPKLFTKLVLDGCWLSLPLIVDKIRGDLMTIANPQRGGLKDHWFLNNPLVMKVTESIATYAICLKYHGSISLLDYVYNLTDVPLLFIQGKDDYIIYREEFAVLWGATPAKEKSLLLTSNEHVRNHLKQKELYKMTCDLFFENSYQDFQKYMTNVTLLEAHLNTQTQTNRRKAIQSAPAHAVTAPGDKRIVLRYPK
jgi:pimeloyl-ACP methyl ester carboxylesterase